jgi:hypothetical protein
MRLTGPSCEQKHVQASIRIVPAFFHGVIQVHFREDYQRTFPIDLLWRRQKNACDTCFGEECAMSSKIGRATVFIALSFVTAVTMLSLANHASEMLPKSQTLT